MTERHLRNRGVTTGSKNISEPCNDGVGLQHEVIESENNMNKQGEVLINMQLDKEDQQSPDNQINFSDESDDLAVMFSRKLEGCLERVMECFDKLQSKIDSDNARLVKDLNVKIEAGHSQLVKLIESSNKTLSDTLTRKIKKANEKLRSEWDNKLEGEVTKIQKDMDKMRSDTTIEILSVSNSVDVGYERLNDRLTEHIEGTNKHLDKVSGEVKAKTGIIEADLNRHVEGTDKDVQFLRQEMSQAKQQNKECISEKVSELTSQIVNERKECQAKFLGISQSLKQLNEKLAVNPTGNKSITSHESDCPSVTAGNNVNNQEGAVSVISTIDQANNQGSDTVSDACASICKCNTTVQNEGNKRKGYENHMNVNPGLLAGCSSINELTLPVYSDHTTQVIGNFLNDLELYFELKGVPENRNYHLQQEQYKTNSLKHG
jgi:hypothetical protein